MRKTLCLWLCALLLISTGCARRMPSSGAGEIPVRYELRVLKETSIETSVLRGFGDGIVSMDDANTSCGIFADADGHLIRTAWSYIAVGGFEDGRARVMRESDIAWVYIDTMMRELGPVVYEPHNVVYDFSETTGEVAASGDYLFGIKAPIEEGGEYITEPIFEWATSPIDEYTYAILAEGDHRNVMISPQGEVLATLPDNVRHAYESDGMFVCQVDDNTYILTDLNGEVVGEAEFSAIGNESNGLRVVMQGNRVGLLDADGNVVVTPTLEADFSYDYTPFIWQDRVACIKDGRLMMLAVEGYAANGARVPLGLHSTVSPANLTDKQAEELMRVLLPKQLQIEFLFSSEGMSDYSQPCPIYEWYYYANDPRFSCVQDIKDYILSTVTESRAQKYFGTYLESAPDAPESTNEYIDYDGRLYRNEHSGGKGFSTTYLIDTTRIVGRTEDSVDLEMNTLYVDEPDDTLYIPTLVKTADGWRVNNDISKNRYPEP